MAHSQLIIVESPSKCKKIESYLNNFYKDYDFKCMASVGHIKNLPRKKLSVDIDDNFKPDFQIIVPLSLKCLIHYYL